MLRDLGDAPRTSGATVIYLSYALRADGSDLCTGDFVYAEASPGFLDEHGRPMACVSGTDGAHVSPVLEPQPSEIVLDKNGYSLFDGRLDSVSTNTRHNPSRPHRRSDGRLLRVDCARWRRPRIEGCLPGGRPGRVRAGRHQLRCVLRSRRTAVGAHRDGLRVR